MCSQPSRTEGGHEAVGHIIGHNAPYDEVDNDAEAEPPVDEVPPYVRNVLLHVAVVVPQREDLPDLAAGYVKMMKKILYGAHSDVAMGYICEMCVCVCVCVCGVWVRVVCEDLPDLTAGRNHSDGYRVKVSVGRLFGE